MTEDEAKTKWCPFFQVALSANEGARKSVHFRNNRVDHESTCIGSQCMAWRWTDTNKIGPKYRRGCCGLAGRP